MPLFGRPAIRPAGGAGGGYRVDLQPWERDLLRSLPGQLRELLTSDDPALERLFPPAYLGADDAERNEEYRRLVRSDLLASHQASLDVLEATADATALDEAQLSAWMGALNDLRLVLGTRLDVSEDMDEEPFAPDDPRASAFAVYRYLSELQWMVVEALSAAL
jgi:hypothetical protein